MQVAHGATLEITLAQFWSSLGPGRLRVEVVFHGIEARREVFLEGSRHNSKLHIRCVGVLQILHVVGIFGNVLAGKEPKARCMIICA